MNRHMVPGIIAASLVAGGAAFAVVSLAGSASPASAPAAAAAPAAQAASTTSGQAAALNQLLADGTGSSTGSSGHRARNPLARLRLLGGMHGEFTFGTKKGSRTLAFERGKVQSVTGNTVVIRATDGTTWTWLLTSTSVVRDKGSKVAATALSAGESVFAGGPVQAGAKDARLIVIRPATSS
jgi:hypothetical protein